VAGAGEAGQEGRLSGVGGVCRGTTEVPVRVLHVCLPCSGDDEILRGAPTWVVEASWDCTANLVSFLFTGACKQHESWTGIERHRNNDQFLSRVHLHIKGLLQRECYHSTF